MGIRANDWAPQDNSYANFVEQDGAKGKGTKPVTQLFRKTMREYLPGDANLPLQQLALLSSLSSSPNSITLNGMRRKQYVEDALACLKQPVFCDKQVKQMYKGMLQIAEELG